MNQGIFRGVVYRKIAISNGHISVSDPGSMFMAGRDITQAGEMGSIDYVLGLRGSCAPPARVQGTLIYKNGEPLAEAERK